MLRHKTVNSGERFDIRRAAQDATITKPGVSPDRARQARLVRAIVRAAWE
jgi:hypothetical protein